MKKAFILIYSIIAALILVFALSFLGYNLYQEQAHADLRTQLRFDKMSSSIFTSVSKTNISNDELIRQIENAIGDKKDFAYIKISTGGKTLYLFPEDYDEAQTKSNLIIDRKKSQAQTVITSGLYSLRPATIFHYTKISFFIILFVALLTIMRLRAAKKRRHRKVVMNRILAVLFLAALIYSIIFCIILIDRHLKGPEPAEPDPDWQQRYANNDPTPAAPTDTPTPTPEPEYTPTPSTVPVGVKRVAFTFDDGPHSTYTRKFVDKLVSYGGKATWFVVGNRIDAETGADLKYAVDQGMEIGIHAWTHEFYFDRNPDKLDDELDKTAAKIKEVTGVEPTLFRPPGGNFTDKQVAAVRYPVILWSVDTEDWKNKSTDTEELRAQNIQKTVDRIMRETKDGSIVLMHEIYSNSYDAFCLAIDRLSKEGYVFVTVSELIGDELRPGHRYSSWYQR